MNTFSEDTGVFHREEPPAEFTIVMVDQTPGSESYLIDGSGPPARTCDEAGLLHWLSDFFGTDDEAQFRHIIERIKMNYRQDENAEPQSGSFV